MSNLLEEFKPAENSIKTRKRVGRGNASGWGGEAGRGHKGQKSRSGYKSRPGFEGGQMPLYKRIPKKRGTGNRILNRIVYKPINLSSLDAKFNEGEEVTIESLIEKGLIKNGDNVKLLGDGALNKSLIIKVNRLSKSAKEKLEKAGCKLES